MAEIPAADWRLIAAGVRDDDALDRLRWAYALGFQRARSACFDAMVAGMRTVRTPDTAPEMPPRDPVEPPLVCARCLCRVAALVNGECIWCHAGTPTVPEIEPAEADGTAL